MKVKEVIAELQKLDQEKDIWVVYDSIRYYAPIPERLATDNDVDCDCYDAGVKVGDYIIE